MVPSPSPASFSSVVSSASLKLSIFKVSVPDSEILELKVLLKASKLPPKTYENQVEDSGSARGTNRFGVTRDWTNQAKSRWENGFDWRLHEEKINEFPQFTTTIPDDGGREYPIHFAALFSQNPSATPLLLVHGWPGSYLEFIPILRLLSTKYTSKTLPYHVIVPSVPGFVFSASLPLGLDFQTKDAALVLDRLMSGLFASTGYVVQGGDIGSEIARYLAAKFDNCKGVHLNYCAMAEPKGLAENSVTDWEKEGLVRAAGWTNDGSAYCIEHATRAATIGLVLSSSPLALLAWIGEKLIDWTDDPLPLDTILEAVSLYYFTSTISTSFWAYRELSSAGSVGGHGDPDWRIPPHKPFGYSFFPKEVSPMPRSWVETSGNLIWYKRHQKGGHFAALEESSALLEDIEDFVKLIASSSSRA